MADQEKWRVALARKAAVRILVLSAREADEKMTKFTWQQRLAEIDRHLAMAGESVAGSGDLAQERDAILANPDAWTAKQEAHEALIAEVFAWPI